MEWYHLTIGKDRHAIFSKNKPETIIAMTCIDENGTKIGLGGKTADYIATANPIMILEMIKEIKEQKLEIEQLENERDWLAEKALQCSEARNHAGYCSYMDNGCTICIQNRNMPTAQDFIDAAKKDLKK